MGLPMIGLGFYIDKAPPAKVKKNKKSKRTKTIKADKGGGKSFIIGGVIFCLIGLGAIARFWFKV